MHREAIAAFEKAAELSGRRFESLGDLGQAYAVTGRRNEALSIVEEMKRAIDGGRDAYYNLALVYVGLGEKDRAFEALDRAVEVRGFLRYLKVDPRLGEIRSDPRFQGVLRRIGLAG